MTRLSMILPPPLTPPHRGEGDFACPALRHENPLSLERPLATPSPLWEGVRGGGFPGARCPA